MALKIKLTCPLGHTCEKITIGIIERCVWYKQISGKHPQSEEIIDEWDCAIAWMPLLSTEIAQTNRGQTQALESFRNETVKIANTAKAIKVIDNGN